MVNNHLFYLGKKRMGMSIAVMRLVNLFQEKGYKVFDMDNEKDINEWFPMYFKEIKNDMNKEE